ncbi:MAG: hypothetical protein JJE39_02345 [Vicinamibacteria bacterium]|nr:hypothetical protein [Vicinamibacteria bacterium]
MKAFWTIFFLGSMLLVGLDVQERRHASQPNPTVPIAGDATGAPTPRP